jgi:hypothetical protein
VSGGALSRFALLDCVHLAAAARCPAGCWWLPVTCCLLTVTAAPLLYTQVHSDGWLEACLSTCSACFYVWLETGWIGWFVCVLCTLFANTGFHGAAFPIAVTYSPFLFFVLFVFDA